MVALGHPGPLTLRGSSSIGPGALASHTSFNSPHVDRERRATVPGSAVSVFPHASTSRNLPEQSIPTEYPEVLEVARQTRKSSVMSADAEICSRSPSNSSVNDGGNQICLCQPFILYRQHQQAGIVAQNPNLSNPDISKIIGEQWRQLPEKTKEEWKALAEEEKTRHAQQYPDYRYKPKRHNRYNGLHSSYGLQPDSPELHPSCHKCGGRTMNGVQVVPVGHDLDAGGRPPYMLRLYPTEKQFDQQKNGQPTPNHPSHHQQANTLPQSSQARPYREILARPIHTQHEYRPYYKHHSLAISGQSLDHDEAPEAKRRRFSSNAGHNTGQAIYEGSRPSPHQVISPNQYLPQSVPIQSAASPHPAQFFQPGYQFGHPLQRRGTHITLPPLQMHGRDRRPSMPLVSPRTPRGSVESIIKAIPVLNKVKILSQVSPSLARRGSDTSTDGMRGAIIAIEGLNVQRVSNMARSLADQLEKGGKFSVRIFGGPDPFAIFESELSKRKKPYDMTYPNFLTMIQIWHSISAEMTEYVMRKPDAASNDGGRRAGPDLGISKSIKQFVNTDAEEKSNNNTLNSKEHHRHTVKPHSPSSAISPGTMLQTADLSLNSPSRALTQQGTGSNEDSARITRPRSRIPAAALAQYAGFRVRPSEDTAIQQPSTHPTSATHNVSAGENRTKRIVPTIEKASHGSLQVSSAAFETMEQHLKSPMTGTGTSDEGAPIFSPVSPVTFPISPVPIPIAIVPHYQLTTVNTCSINMPITDAYSPHSHWQWLATLWRGCVGPDITIVIETADDDNGLSSNAAEMKNDNAISTGGSSNSSTVLNLAPSPAKPNQKFAPMLQNQTTNAGTKSEAVGVDVRLSDYNTVIVRSSSGNSNRAEVNGSNNAQSGGDGDRDRNNDSTRHSEGRTNTSPHSSSRAAASGPAPAPAPASATNTGMGPFAGLARYSTSNQTTSTRNDNNEAQEAWEKAKRRVGFEVEEFLTK